MYYLQHSALIKSYNQQGKTKMKKLFQLVLLTASMTFAAISIDGNSTSYGCNYSPSFRLYNSGSTIGKGFRIYAYFSNFDSNPLYDLEEYATAATNVRVQKTATHVYRVVMDFANSTIQANNYFPANVTRFFTIKTRNNSTNRCWEPYPWRARFGDIVVENASGQVIYGRHPGNRSRIGILVPANSGSLCPSGKVDVTIRLDAEDNNNRTRIVSGNSSPRGIEIRDGGLKFTYCSYISPNPPKVPYDYAVLKLDDYCPDGTYNFRRYHDTEDHDNHNYATGSYWPNEVNENANLEYCLVPRDLSSTRVYPFSSNFGIFASYASGSIFHSEVFFDDEDTDNENSWTWYGMPSSMKNRANVIISGTTNTTYHVAKWNGGGSLNKSAETEIASKPVDNMVVINKPAPAALKGINRTTVAVELQSQGDVEVSIVDINGSVVAKVAEKNLLPGVHQLNWNSANVPNGFYVVFVKQNGVHSAKNVILK